MGAPLPRLRIDETYKSFSSSKCSDCGKKAPDHLPFYYFSDKLRCPDCELDDLTRQGTMYAVLNAVVCIVGVIGLVFILIMRAMK